MSARNVKEDLTRIHDKSKLKTLKGKMLTRIERFYHFRAIDYL